MKTKLLFIIIILCLGACNSSEPTPSKTVSVLFDITDPLIAHPDASELYKLLDADNTNQKYEPILFEENQNPVILIAVCKKITS